MCAAAPAPEELPGRELALCSVQGGKARAEATAPAAQPGCEDRPEPALFQRVILPPIQGPSARLNRQSGSPCSLAPEPLALSPKRPPALGSSAREGGSRSAHRHAGSASVAWGPCGLAPHCPRDPACCSRASSWATALGSTVWGLHPQAQMLLRRCGHGMGQFPAPVSHPVSCPPSAQGSPGKTVLRRSFRTLGLYFYQGTGARAISRIREDFTLLTWGRKGLETCPLSSQVCRAGSVYRASGVPVYRAVFAF